MLPRTLLAILVFSLPVLLVIFAVASGGYLLLDSADDQVATSALRSIAFVLLGLIVSDALLLVGVLGWQAYVATERTPDSTVIPSREPSSDNPDRSR